MSTPAREALDRHATPWLFATALATTAPHFIHQPPWLSAMAGAMLVWAIWLWWKDQRLPGRWILIPLVGAGSTGILLEFHTLFGRDAGVAMLVMFMTMKLLELKSRRDAMVVVTLGYFLLLTHYLYSQSIPTGIWLLAAMWLVTATLIRLHGGPASQMRDTLRDPAAKAQSAHARPGQRVEIAPAGKDRRSGAGDVPQSGLPLHPAPSAARPDAMDEFLFDSGAASASTTHRPSSS
jgi:hypothetical protein